MIRQMIIVISKSVSPIESMASRELLHSHFRAETQSPSQKIKMATRSRYEHLAASVFFSGPEILPITSATL